jgi:glycosyltransferase involved in cell wall biosynthesis
MPRRVLFWSELFWPHIGGIEVFGTHLLRALQGHGYNFAVVTSHSNLPLPDGANHEGARIFRFPFRMAFETRDAGLFLELRRRIVNLKQTYRPDLIHINAVSPSILFHVQTAESWPAPVLVTLHQEVLTKQSDESTSLAGRLLRSADRVNSVSAAVLTQAHRLVPEIVSRSSVIHNGLNEPSMAPTVLPFAPARLLCLGRLTRQKGFDIALAALSLIRTHFANVRLVIAGDGVERRELEQQIDELGLSGAVECLGWVAPDQIPTLINSATVVLMPSRFEGLPLVALQAAMAARPIVASRVGGIPEVVVHQETGLLVDPENASALADAVTFLLANPAIAAEMGHSGRRRVREVFSWEKCVVRYKNLYDQLTRERGREDSF